MTTEPIWSPDPATAADCNAARFIRWLRDNDVATIDGFGDLWQWSVDDLDGFWRAVWGYYGVGPAPAGPALADARMPGAQWFPGTEVNFAAQVFAGRADGDPALVAVCEDGTTQTWSWHRLRAETAAVATLLRGLGVEAGDRVVGYLPNIPKAVAALLGAASIGAVWSVCNQDLSVPAVVDRFAQLAPTVLLAATGSHHNGRAHDRLAAIGEIAAELPTLTATVVVDHLGTGLPDGTIAWPAARIDAPLPLQTLRFDHPLWTLFSSGTTGRPKGIVHSHGGIVLEELVFLGLHLDLGPGDIFFWHASTSWVMWNHVVCALLLGATAVLYEGSPTYPDTARLWDLADAHGVTVLGASPAYLQACRRDGVLPRSADRPLEALRRFGVTGSPLTEDLHRWIQAELGAGIGVHSLSGGTDLAGPLVIGSPMTPEYAGEIGGRCLGAAVSSYDEEGRPVVGTMGELVVTAPIPSMPVGLWDDDDGARYRETYFDRYPGVWRQGDWMTLTDRGTVVIHGRSDATLNRRGIRLGTAEIYQAVEGLAEVADALVVGVEQPDGGYWMPLFVQLSPGVALDPKLEERLRTAIRDGASAHHVPDEVIAVRGIPHTLTGKRLEVPIKRLLLGAAPDAVLQAGAVDDPSLLAEFCAVATSRR